MEQLASLNLLLPLAWWVPLSAIAAGLIGLSTVRRARKMRVAAARPTRLPTALVGVALLVLMPLGAGFFGGTFALKRATASLLDEGGDPVIAWGIQQAFAHHRPLHLSALRERIRAHHTPTHHGPLAIFQEMPSLIEEGCWRALAKAGTDGLRWDDVLVRARLLMKTEVLHPIAEQLRASAWVDLLTLLGVLAAAHGLALGGVWLSCRKRLTVET